MDLGAKFNLTMGLRAKFNLVILAAFAIGFLVAAVVLNRVFVESARNQVLQNARIMMTAANAIRTYTADDLVPLLPIEHDGKFVAETVPAFAAQTNFKAVQQSFAGYTYREPALNPTNPNDRPSAVEIDLINRFRTDPKLEELTGVRDNGAGPVFYLARPIKATEPCLACHSTPDKAPPAMVAKYGASNGFGWQLGEIVGIQTLTVPIAEELKGSVELAVNLAAGLLLIFVATYLAIRYALQVMLVRPLRELSVAAHDASLSTAARVGMPTSGTSEIQDLAQSIRRLHESLLKALRQLSSRPSPPQS
jgi:HAMP domain-containing protein